MTTWAGVARYNAQNDTIEARPYGGLVNIELARALTISVEDDETFTVGAWFDGVDWRVIVDRLPSVDLAQSCLRAIAIAGGQTETEVDVERPKRHTVDPPGQN